MVTSDFRQEVEIQPFCACAMHPAIIIGILHFVHCGRGYGADTTFHKTYFQILLLLLLLLLTVKQVYKRYSLICHTEVTLLRFISRGVVLFYIGFKFMALPIIGCMNSSKTTGYSVNGTSSYHMYSIYIYAMRSAALRLTAVFTAAQRINAGLTASLPIDRTLCVGL